MTGRRLAIRVLAPAILAVMLAGCSGVEKPRAVVLITLDTMRADRLGCYGYGQAETPNLDELAAGAVRFDQAMAPVPVTLPSHASMFTGRYPPVHGIRYNGMFHLAEESLTLAEILRDAGWKTAGMPAAFPLSESTGISQGFDEYHDLFRDLDLEQFQGSDPESLLAEVERKAAGTTDLGIRFLEESAGEPFLLWLHYWDPHYPYRPPFPFSSTYRDRPYDGEVAYMDVELGRFLEALRASGQWDETLVIVAGDHGEGLYDHNEKMHANLVYETTMRVPLIVKPAGARVSRVIDDPVSLVDLLPTVLDSLGMEIPENDGMSLVPLLEGDEGPPRDLYFESLAGSLVFGWSPLEGIRRGDWKYTRSTEPELYDLGSDPGETENLFGTDPGLESDLEDSLTDLEAYWENLEDTASVASTPLDSASADMLASLGYLGGFLSEDRKQGLHPSRGIHLEMDLFLARDLIAEQQHLPAIKKLEQILAQDPTNRYGLTMAANASFALKRMQDALDYSALAIEHYPEFTPARIKRGEVLVTLGRIVEAEATFREGLEYNPEDTGLNYRLAVALYALERSRESLEIVDRMLDIGSESPSFDVLRAACQARLGDGQGSLRSLRTAIEKGYRDREVLENEPLLDALRVVPGFAEVLSEIPES